ncbi:MAG: DUF6600 domain-containing protein [Bryobacteraceae bacterium]
MRSLLCLLLPVGLLPTAWAGPARYARLGEFEGVVEVQLQSADAWMAAERNLPLPEGAWLRTGGAARLEVELDDGSVLRLGSNSAGALADYAQLSTGQKVTLVTLDRGLAYFTAQPRSHDSVVLAVPGAQVTFTGPARLRLQAADGWSRIAVLEGSVRFSLPAAEIGLFEGQTIRLDPSDPVHFSLDRVVAEMSLDRWSAERDRALASATSAQHAIARYGLADLDAAGAWVETDQWGAVWKPKTAADWTPFRNGHWRWYNALGYTFVGGETWGWLPYHYGRWAHSSELGWIWVPGLSQVFKPGDVFWLSGATLAGWGPLAPGERWPGEQGLDPNAAPPSQFAPAYITYATYRPDARVIDPAGFTGRPDEPLKVASLVSALPSPPLEAATLEALRPLSVVDGVRVAPAIPGIAYEDPPVEPDSAAEPVAAQPSDDAPPAADVPPPAAMPNTPPDPAAPDPETAPYPPSVAIYPALVIGAQPKASGRVSNRPGAGSARSSENTKAAAASAAPHQKPTTTGEQRLYRNVVEHNQDPAEQIRLLDVWRQEVPFSRLESDRTFLYMQAYSRLSPPRPDAVVQYGEYLIRAGLPFPNSPVGDAQKLSVLYQVTVNVPKLAQPSARQVNLARDVARSLQDYLPVFFSLANRPAGVDEALWAKARSDMEGAAKHTLAFAAQKR